MDIQALTNGHPSKLYMHRGQKCDLQPWTHSDLPSGYVGQYYHGDEVQLPVTRQPDAEEEQSNLLHKKALVEHYLRATKKCRATRQALP
jgi:hypothetical protein